MDKWASIEPSMMSDEDDIESDDQSLKRRRPDWRSLSFNVFMDELDERSYGASKHPRKVRILGTPLKGPHPDNVRLDGEPK